MSTSEAVTRNVRVRVEAEYSPERSNPKSQHWFFLYTVTISNEGDTGSSPTGTTAWRR